MRMDAAGATPPVAGVSGPALDRRDGVALLLIVLGYGLAVLLLSPVHSFAYLDDWTYARGVADVVQGSGFHPSEYAQATLITPTYWGVAFAGLFGFSFTTLTLATLALSLVAALAFYALLRRLGYGPGLSGVGVGLLALNPYYLVLSYSFMTEIPFVALLLLSCLCYGEGLRGGQARWLWAGAAFGALAYLTRQFGLVTPLAALLWLAYARRLSWSRCWAVSLLPLLAVGGYFVWSRPFGPTFSASVGREELVALLRPFTWANRASHFVYLAAFLPGLTLPLWGRVRRPRFLAGAMVAVAGAVYGLWQVKGSLVAQGTSTINDLSYTWLQPAFGDPVPIYCLGAALTLWLLWSLVERAAPQWRALWRRQRPPAPSDFLALVAVILFGGTYLVSAGFLDRYWLPVLPFLIAVGLGTLRGVGRRGLLLRGGLFALVAGYGIVMHLDDYAGHTAAWNAGQWLVARGVSYRQIKSYAGWEGYYLGDVALREQPSQDVAVLGRVFAPDLIIDPQYVVSPDPLPGYTVLARFPYPNLREGGLMRAQLALVRDAP